jgi:hypothetical protein
MSTARFAAATDTSSQHPRDRNHNAFPKRAMHRLGGLGSMRFDALRLTFGTRDRYLPAGFNRSNWQYRHCPAMDCAAFARAEAIARTAAAKSAIAAASDGIRKPPSLSERTPAIIGPII